MQLLCHCPVQRARELQLTRARELQLTRARELQLTRARDVQLPGALLPPVRLPLMRAGRCWSSHSGVELTSSCRDRQRHLH